MRFLALDSSTLMLSLALVEERPPRERVVIAQEVHGPPQKQSELLPEVIPSASLELREPDALRPVSLATSRCRSRSGAPKLRSSFPGLFGIYYSSHAARDYARLTVPVRRPSVRPLPVLQAHGLQSADPNNRSGLVCP